MATDLVCPNCKSDRRMIVGEKPSNIRLVNNRHGDRGKGHSYGITYLCFKCGCRYSNSILHGGFVSKMKEW